MLNEEIKTVKYLLPAQKIDMGGFPVKQALPTQHVSDLDPFLLLHHGRTKYSDRRLAKHQGVDPHPHRGFSPVTFVVNGEVHHRDSRGNSQIAKKGEVQWMHAGRGIIHSERPSEALAQSREYQEIIQLWINSPAASKMKIPEYVHVESEAMPAIWSKDGKVDSNLISGKVEDQIGKVKGESPLLILWSFARDGGSETYEVPSDFNVMIYLIKGKLRIKRYGSIEAEHLAIFEHGGSKITVTAEEESEFLVLSGQPIGEKVVQSGPFVMNSETQILEAMRDYRMGKMGILIEDD